MRSMDTEQVEFEERLPEALASFCSALHKVHGVPIAGLGYGVMPTTAGETGGTIGDPRTVEVTNGGTGGTCEMGVMSLTCEYGNTLG